MGLDSESSCEEPETVKVETTDEDCVEQTTDDNESSNKQDEKTHICVYEGCSKKFSRPSKLQAHLCYHTGERRFKCEHDGCDKSYSRPQHLRRHITTNHNAESKYKKLLRCPYPDCMRELSNQQNLKKHYYRKHERKYPYTCEYCDKGFPKHQQLKQHLYQHTGIPPFRCSECNIGFTKIGDLNRHNRGHKTYTCTFADCGVVLKAWTHMRTHIKLKHPSEFPCDDCGRSFRTKSRLKIHASIHKEPEERETFPCTYPNCPRFYFKKSNLTHHVKSSHEGKKFECTYEDCGRELCTQQKLEQHMKLHKTNRPTPHRRKKSKNKRRDAGTHKRSMAVKLSGIKIPYQAEKRLLNPVSNIYEELIVIQSSPNHTLIDLEMENSSLSMDKDIQNESSNEIIENGVSVGVTGNSIREMLITEKEARYCNETVTSVNCARESVDSTEISPAKEIETEFKENKGHLSDNESDRLSSKSEIILTVPFDPINERNELNFISEQNECHEVDSDSHSVYSKSLNLNENIAFSILDDNCVPLNIALNSDENSNISLNLEETSNISSFDINIEELMKCDHLFVNSTLNVPIEDEMCSSVMCIINSDHGTLLQEVDATSADNRKNECLIEDIHHLQSTSKRENVEQECNKKSGVVTETKLLNPPPKDNSKEFSTSDLSNSNKRKVSSNRKILANYKKLKLAGVSTKISSTSSNRVPRSLGKQDLYNCIYTPKEKSHVELDTMYKEDKYIEDCLRVIDTKDLEERSKILDDMLLRNRQSKADEIKNVISKRQICVTEGDKNISGILEKPLTLKQHMFLRKKQKLDQIVNSLRSVKNKRSESVNSKSCQERSNSPSLKPQPGDFYVGDSKAVCSVSNNDNLRDLCVLTQKAVLERTDDIVNSPADERPGYIKQEDFWKRKFRGNMTIKTWLPLMKKAMEHFFPSLKQTHE